MFPGFYTFSQNPVVYVGITEDAVPGVPLPLAGLGAFGIMRRRKT